MNPFTSFRSADPPSVIGREGLIRQVLEGITHHEPRPVELVGLKGLGTSSLLRFLHHPDGARKHDAFAPFFGRMPLHLIAVDCSRFAGNSFSSWLWDRVRETPVLRELVAADPHVQRLVHDADDGRATASAVMVDVLTAIAERGERVVLLLDHLNQAVGEKAVGKIDEHEARSLRPVAGVAGMVIATEHQLAELQPSVASSWFPGVLLTHHIRPMALADANKLIDAALAGAGEGETFEIDKRDELLAITGRHTYFVLQGSAEYYDLSQVYTTLDDSQRLTLVEERLVESMQREFHRFWDRARKYHAALHAMAEAKPPTDLLTRYLRAVDALVLMGLVVIEDGQPKLFSTAWRRYIAEQPAPTVVEPTATYVADARPLVPDDLSPLETQLLETLRERSGQTVPYADLVLELWPDEDIANDKALAGALHKLRQVVMRVRQQMRESAERDRILNKRGIGYEYRPHKPA